MKDLQTLYVAGAVGGLSDGQLVDRFLAGGDGAAEAAFAALAQRHGPMVLRVCRQMLRDPHEAQDAFQATFLVFARKAGSVSRRDSVASWLHGVARRVAMRARADAARRLRHERRAAAMSPEESAAGSGRDEPWPELHEEIGRLPERYRTPVVLCYLEGLTTEAAAQRLGCPQGTILSRLSRARDRLRDRLTRRGVAPAAALLAAGLAREADAAALPVDLVETTVRVSLSFAGKRAMAAALGSTRAGALAGGVLYAMTISKLKILGAAALALALTWGGVQTFARLGPSTEQAGPGSDAGERDRSVAKLQSQLAEATRRNAELRNDLERIRKDMEALRAGQTAAGGADASPRNPGNEPIKPTGALAGLGGMGHSNFFGGGPDRPFYQRNGNLFLVTFPSGDKFSIVDINTNKAQSIRLSGSKEAPVKATPIVGAGLIALHLEGAKIPRIFVFSIGDSAWYGQDLREPVEKASPTVSQSAVVFQQGRYIYAFSKTAKRWGVLELPEGSLRSPTVEADTVTVENDGQIDEFDLKTGEWKHTDIRAIIDAAIEAAEKEEGEKEDRPRN